MNIGKAFAIFKNISSKKYTLEEKYEAIQQVINAPTINSITKAELLSTVSWLFNKQRRYRWHDLRDNPKDVPNVNYPSDTFFEVVQKNNEEDPLRMAMQYDDVYGFGFYHDIYDPVSLGYVDTEFRTAEEEGYEEVVAWREIEKFESEEEHEN